MTKLQILLQGQRVDGQEGHVGLQGETAGHQAGMPPTEIFRSSRKEQPGSSNSYTSFKYPFPTRFAQPTACVMLCLQL